MVLERKDVPKEHCWNLGKLYASDAAWEDGLSLFRELSGKIGDFKGTLGASGESLKACLDFMMSLGMLEERLGYYSHLRESEDGGDGAAQDMHGRFLQAAVQAEAQGGYLRPEILAIPPAKMKEFTAALPEYEVYLNKLTRYRPHVLSEAEERLLALQEEANATAQKSFSMLSDVDMDFGLVSVEGEERPLTQSTFQSFLMNGERSVRERAYLQFMGGFSGHKNTLAALLSGSVNLDIYRARVRGYSSARAAALFSDDMPEAVYDNLVSAVRAGFPALHRYYELRRRVLGLTKLRMFDTKVSLVPDVSSRHTFEEACRLVLASLAPLGEDYGKKLSAGLFGGWVDRYENKGKHSGGFSAGSFVGDPYILLNYKDDLLRDVFTLAHEAGHSMHSLYSAASNPFQHYNYTIFEAEVASTFNEQLLIAHLMKNAETGEFTAYLIGKQIDDIIATFFRQTMFAEFELRAHRAVEEGRPLTLDRIMAIYGELLSAYFGPALELADMDSLEALRIPHFYRAFYVYKYATGIAAASALSARVLGGGDAERDAYFAFL
ncbi:MAG: oligoendopeptidase F, partial [Spirochaetales bacterium]|nr:oligoendopeptidase F [Spirochaetales bacterium]